MAFPDYLCADYRISSLLLFLGLVLTGEMNKM